MGLVSKPYESSFMSKRRCKDKFKFPMGSGHLVTTMIARKFRENNLLMLKMVTLKRFFDL